MKKEDINWQEDNNIMIVHGSKQIGFTIQDKDRKPFADFIKDRRAEFLTLSDIKGIPLVTISKKFIDYVIYK